MTSSSPRQSRLISLSIYCAATLLHQLSPADAFSLAQNAAATSQQQPDGGSNSAGSPSTRPSAAASASARPSVSAPNPFRGSLNSRQPRRSHRLPADDFALRMGMQSSDEDHGAHDSNAAEKDSNEAASSLETSCSSSQDKHDGTLPSSSASTSPSLMDDESKIYERRAFLSGMLATTAATIAVSTTTSADPANAYEQAYPLELQSTPIGEYETSANSLSKLKEERMSSKRAKIAAAKSELRSNPLGFNTQNFGVTIAGAATWALALWFAAGSRSNPLATPLANVLYDPKEETWLRDRNDGYFAELPLGFTAILSAVFVFLGVLLDRVVYFLADGDAEASLQLAGVSAIGGAFWEVGRLAAKEKAPTREEYDREALLYSEFDEFATKRLTVGRGSCHRSDVISAFRRYNPKYRVADNEQYPLADIEIERILKVWNRERGSRSEMSSAGFFSGISVDDAADAFAPR